MSNIKTFHESVKRGDLESVRASLTENPSLLDARNEAGQDALLLSKYYGRADITVHLLSLAPKLDVFNASAIGDETFVLREVDRDPALLAAHSTDGWTPLHLAAFFGNRDLALKLIERGAEVDARSTNAMKNTPLHAAAAGGKIELVRLLLEEGANVNATQHGGWTALHAAAQSGNAPMLELLLAHGADLKARAENNQSALDLALMKGHQEIATLLDQLGGAPHDNA
jgi:ankyrin repeat protein